MVEGIIWRYRVGTPWRDVPRSFGPWQTLWKRHRRYSGDGTWDRIHAELLADADAVGGDALKQVVIRKLFPAGVDGAAMAANVTALIEYRNRAVHLYAADLGEMVYPSCRPVF